MYLLYQRYLTFTLCSVMPLLVKSFNIYKLVKTTCNQRKLLAEKYKIYVSHNSKFVLNATVLLGCLKSRNNFFALISSNASFSSDNHCFDWGSVPMKQAVRCNRRT